MASIAVEHVRSGRKLGLKPVHWLMLGIIGLALGFGAWSLQGSLTRYVTVTEAKQASGNVQVFGYLYSPGAYDAEQNWTFDVQGEDGATMKIVYPTKPGNFEDAVSVVATGQFNREQNIFEAQQLLVKCPSKYQEQQASVGQ